jgi:periplasmic protein TonB
MASFAHLSPEERIGLGIAAAAHVALVAGLMWQVRDEPARLPTPERIEVSLAQEVSLQSTAPDPVPEQQAAIAPVLAEQPAPAPLAEPEPEPVPVPPVREVVRPAPAPRPTASARPTPTPTARATPSPRPSPRATPSPRPSPTVSARPAPRPSASASPAPTPSARPTTRAGGSRIGADFLEGASSGERSETRGTPAAAFGAAEQASLASAITRAIKPHWQAPQGPDAELLVTVLRFRLNPDGSLAGNPEVVRQSGVNATNETQKARHAEQAIRAVRLAAPFDLPEQFYDRWRVVTSQFDRRL